MVILGMVGFSGVHQRLLEKLTKFALTDAEILITGPTGVGKELYAKFVHHNSRRANAAFVPVNCGAIPDSLLENELFGHVGGALSLSLSPCHLRPSEARNSVKLLPTQRYRPR
jgi:transcriptional regulator with GAF, ATPase, and Fis domain